MRMRLREFPSVRSSIPHQLHFFFCFVVYFCAIGGGGNSKFFQWKRKLYDRHQSRHFPYSAILLWQKRITNLRAVCQNIKTLKCTSVESGNFDLKILLNLGLSFASCFSMITNASSIELCDCWS